MKRAWGAAVVAVLVSTGCTSVRMVQRDGCWVRSTERFPNQVTEDLGPCTRPAPKWSEDRLARMVQECMIQSDYRWHNRAVQAWSQHQALPPQESEEKTLNACMNQAANALMTENASLKGRLSDVSTDRDALKATIEKDETFLRQSHDRLTTALGEAAKKPAPAAVATATSDGRASTQSDLSAEPGTATVTTVPMQVPVQMPNPTAAMCPLPARPAAKARVVKRDTSASSRPSCGTGTPWADSIDKVAKITPLADKATAPSATEEPAPDHTPEP